MFDSQGRRFEKKVTVAGIITSWERYLYRDYLQIAAFDVTETESSSSSSEASGNSTYQLSTISYTLKHIIFWDPGEPTATRPLAIYLVNDQLYFPTVDLTKNVCELIDVSGTLSATYDYAPFGAVTSTGTVANPLQWSSEHYDSELGLVYYNYRHYSPYDGRFLSRDPIEEQGGWNLYAFVSGRSVDYVDVLGLGEIVLIYDGNDSMFKSWAERLKRAILNGEPTPFGTSVEYEEGDCITCEKAGAETIKKLVSSKDIKYVGTFGHGRPGEFWVGWTDKDGEQRNIKFALPGIKAGSTVVKMYGVDIFATLDYYKVATIEFYHCQTGKAIDCCHPNRSGTGKYSVVSYLKAIINERNIEEESLSLSIHGNEGPIGNKWPWDFLFRGGAPRLDPPKKEPSIPPQKKKKHQK